jgi:hypothetical protein
LAQPKSAVRSTLALVDRERVIGRFDLDIWTDANFTRMYEGFQIKCLWVARNRIAKPAEVWGFIDWRATVFRSGTCRNPGGRISVRRFEVGCVKYISAQPYRPPATSRIAPVTYDASLDNSQRIAEATSSGWPPLCMGTCVLKRSTRAGSPPFACRPV